MLNLKLLPMKPSCLLVKSPIFYGEIKSTFFLLGGLEQFLFFNWECHHPNWRSPSFPKRGRYPTNQFLLIHPGICSFGSSLGRPPQRASPVPRAVRLCKTPWPKHRRLEIPMWWQNAKSALKMQKNQKWQGFQFSEQVTKMIVKKTLVVSGQCSN